MGIVGAVFTPERGDIRTTIVALASGDEVVADFEGCIVVASAAPTVTCMRSLRPLDAHSGRPVTSSVRADFAVMDGSPVLHDGSTYRMPSRADLERVVRLSPDAVHREMLGQYALVRSMDSGVELIADPNSLRSLFIYQATGLVLFASRLQGITRIVKGLQLEWPRFGSHWLAHNQLSDRFFVKDVLRLAGRRTVKVGVEGGSVRIEEQVQPVRALPAEESGVQNPFDPVASFLSKHEGPVRLALSGGIDSRLLLALALRGQPKDFGVFAYESHGSADAGLAKQLAQVAGVACNVIPCAELRSLHESGALESFAEEAFCSVPLSASVQLAHYRDLYEHEPGMVLIDGGFGEIGRAQFYRRIEMMRRFRSFRRPLLNDCVEALSFARADVFSDGALAMMKAGFEDDVEAFMRDLETGNADRPEDWAGVTFRRANFFGHSQAWIDRHGVNFMPFGQEPFIRDILGKSLRSRRGGRIYRNEIYSIMPKLASVPLAKGSLRYPFRLSGNLVPLYARLVRSRKPSVPIHGRNRLGLWLSEREFVSDIVASAETRTYAGYDVKKIDRLLQDVFTGTGMRHNALDWFLSFELWRRAHALS